MQTVLHVFIQCLPPKTTAQQKGVFVVNGKPRFFTKAKVAQAGNDLCSLLAPYRPTVPFIGPLAVTAVMCYPWRKSEKKGNIALGYLPMDVKPDADNLNKMFFDAMSRTAYWTDDAVVADIRTLKGWADVPGIALKIEYIAPMYLPEYTSYVLGVLSASRKRTVTSDLVDVPEPVVKTVPVTAPSEMYQQSFEDLLG